MSSRHIRLPALDPVAFLVLVMTTGYAVKTNLRAAFLVPGLRIRLQSDLAVVPFLSFLLMLSTGSGSLHQSEGSPIRSGYRWFQDFETRFVVYF